MTEFTHDNLEFLATCYVTGDLSTAEHDAFEQQLASEQQAREAVAAAVELLTAVAAAHADEPRVSSTAVHAPDRTQPWTWMALGAAACLAVVGTIHLLSDWPADSSARIQSFDAQLAIAWSETREAWGDESLAAGMLPDDLTVSGESPMSATDELPATAPEWMVAAVSGLKQQQQFSTPLDEPQPPADPDTVSN